MTPLALLLLLTPAAGDVLNEPFRAVTIVKGEHHTFRVKGLETVTGSSGRCLEEGVESGEEDAIWIEGACEGLRTVMVARADGSVIQVMACGEDPEHRTAEQLKLRQKLQSELKKHRSITACVRNGRVELWGWWRTDAEAATVKALEKKYGLEKVHSFVEKLPAEE